MLNQIFIATFHNLLCVWRLQIAFRDQFTVTHRFELPQDLRFLYLRMYTHLRSLFQLFLWKINFAEMCFMCFVYKTKAYSIFIESINVTYGVK